MIEQARYQAGPRRLSADVAVVGSGAGGAMAALELAQRGLKVLILEEGPALQPHEMNQLEDRMLPKLYQERGGRSTIDLAIRVLGGRCVGGSTVHNINLCKRTPDQVLEHWAQEFGLSGATPDAMRPVFESVERDLTVTQIPGEWRNENNRILERGVENLGYRGGPLSHNRSGCQRSGFCEIGCPFNAKQNAAKVLIPRALEHGARLLSDARVVRVLFQRGMVSGLSALALTANGEPHAALEVDARAVVLAGSAIGSAALAAKSALPDPHSQLGVGLALHPGAAVAGLFEHEVVGFQGIPQSYECTEFLDFAPGSDRRIWITTAFAHPIGAATMLPGFGAEHRRWMLAYRRIAVLTAMVHDQSSGRVSARADGRARIEYRLSEADQYQLASGVRACARLLFAAGARRVLVPSTPAIELERADAVESIPDSIARPHQLRVAAVHPMGSLRMGGDPRRSSVGPNAEHHQVRGLFVLDSSLFPSSLGVPPQISVYAFARHLAPGVTERL